jgi:ribosomal protein L11 methyltransferase
MALGIRFDSMISPDTLLHIYEVQGEVDVSASSVPATFVGLWNEEQFAYLFFTAAEDDFVAGILSEAALSVSSRHIIRYGDWQAGVPDKGVIAGGVQFVAGDCGSPPRGALLLDPSVVFGDGDHPTTLSCLREIEKLARSAHIYSLLDLGAGSGILALAAAAMGVRRIVAVDKNRLAARVARRNVELNSLSSVIQVVEGEARSFITNPFDIVAANLPFQVLRELAGLNAVKLHRFWIISGINAAQAEVLEELFIEQGYETLTRRQDRPPWATFTMVNNARRRR